MMYARSAALTIGSLLVLVSGADAKEPRTDLYGDPLPPGAVARLGTIRLRHACADVAFSPDGKQLISCDSEGEIRFWDAASGKLVRRTRLAGGARHYQRVILLPDAATTAAVQGHRLYLHDTQSGAERGHIDDLAERALIRFSPDGAALVVEIAVQESGSRSLEVWDVRRVQKRQRLADASPEAGVIECVFFRDGKRLAGFTSARDEIVFWDVQTGKLLDRKPADGERSVELIAFSPGGKTLAVGWGPSSNTKAQVQLLATDDYHEKAVLPVPAAIRAKISGKMVFSPDGRRLAGSSANDPLGEYGILLWDVAGKHEARLLPERRGVSFTFAPDGKTLACHDATGSSIRLWDADSGRPRLVETHYDRPAKMLVASPDGKLLAADTEGAIHLWDSAGHPLHSLKHGASPLAACVISSDGARLIGSDSDEFPVLQEWEVASGKKGRRFELPAAVRLVHGLAMSADGTRLTAVASNGRAVGRESFLLAWDAQTGKRLSQLTFKYEGRAGAHFALPTVPPQTPAAFAPDGETVVRMWNEKQLDADDYWRGFRVGLEDVRTGTLRAELPKGVGLPVVFSPDGRLLAAPVFPFASGLPQADVTQELVLIEAASGEELLRLPADEIDYVLFTSEGRGLAAINKKSVRIWDVETGQLLREMPWPDGNGDTTGIARIQAVAVLPGGRLATALNDGEILVWDLAPATWPASKADFARKPTAALCSDLDSDARTAQRAIRALAAEPAQTVRFLDKHLTPASADRAQLEKRVASLDSASFVEREAATQSLARIREAAAPMLRQVLQAKPSLELRLRLETILAEPKRLPNETVRTLRGIEVLERIGTTEARRLLEKLAQSAAAVEAREAHAALRRLSRKIASATEGSTR